MILGHRNHLWLITEFTKSWYLICEILYSLDYSLLSIGEEILKAKTKWYSHTFINDNTALLRQCFSHATGSRITVSLLFFSLSHIYTHTFMHKCTHSHNMITTPTVNWLPVFMLPLLKVNSGRDHSEWELFFIPAFIMHGCSIFSCCCPSDSESWLKY